MEDLFGGMGGGMGSGRSFGGGGGGFPAMGGAGFPGGGGMGGGRRRKVHSPALEAGPPLHVCIAALQWPSGLAL